MTNNSNKLLDQTIVLDLKKVWPLLQCGEYLQQIKINVHGKQYDFLVHLAVNANSLQAIAYNDIFGKIYRLTWESSGISWEYNKYIPIKLKPDNIILDFLLCNLPLNVLNSAMHGAYGVDLGNLRLIKNELRILRKIYRYKKINNLYSKVVINNNQSRYSVIIETGLQ
jgi:hypothetical protein